MLLSVDVPVNNMSPTSHNNGLEPGTGGTQWPHRQMSRYKLQFQVSTRQNEMDVVILTEYFSRFPMSLYYTETTSNVLIEAKRDDGSRS